MARRVGKGGARQPREATAEPEEVLRAKYYDYCSARVCDVFLELEDERVFELARAAEHRVGAVPGALNFQDLAALLVEQLLDEMAVPDFESWAEDYRRHPERYEPYLLGLWRSAVESTAASR
jgi:hypothetical protein